MQEVQQFLGVLIFWFLGLAAVAYVVWALVMVWKLKATVEGQKLLIKSSRRYEGSALKTAMEAWNEVTKLRREMEEMKCDAKDIADRGVRTHNMANVALGLAKKHEVDSETISDLQEQIEETDSYQRVLFDNTKQKMDNLNENLNIMFRGLAEQKQAIEGLKKSKANAVKPKPRKKAA